MEALISIGQVQSELENERGNLQRCYRPSLQHEANEFKFSHSIDRFQVNFFEVIGLLGAFFTSETFILLMKMRPANKNYVINNQRQCKKISFVTEGTIRPDQRKTRI